jgi:exo-1,4-beta-D-glucosaminidase
MESIQAMFSPDHYWPVDDTWNFHCGRNEFNNMDRYMTAFNKRYGPAEHLDDFAKRAQAANYEGIRAMFEAFGVRKPVATGIVQWMMNAAWPKMYWQLYDYYLMPGGAYYGARKANRPLNIAYDYSNNTIHIVNDSNDSFPNLNAEIKAFSVDSKELLSQNIKASIGENESKQIFQLPSSTPDPPVYFLNLSLKDPTGKVLADNFYWLSSKPDVIDFVKSEWYVSPNKEYADFTSLNEMPAAEIKVTENWKPDGVTVNVNNPGSQIAFFVELKVVRDKTGRTVLPVFWNDNYVSLLPGETKTLTAQFSADDLHGEKPVLRYSGWNVKGNE